MPQPSIDMTSSPAWLSASVRERNRPTPGRLCEARDSHWMMAYGDSLRELQYAARKIGINWVEI